MLKTSQITILFSGLILAQVLGMPTAWAEKSSWVQVHQFYWYNSKYTFVDQETGFLVVELAESRRKGGFNYSIEAIDCDRWVAYPLTVRDQDRNYTFYTNWKTNRSGPIRIKPDSFADSVARNLCPDIYKLPQRNIPK